MLQTATETAVTAPTLAIRRLSPTWQTWKSPRQGFSASQYAVAKWPTLVGVTRTKTMPTIHASLQHHTNIRCIILSNIQYIAFILWLSKLQLCTTHRSYYCLLMTLDVEFEIAWRQLLGILVATYIWLVFCDARSPLTRRLVWLRPGGCVLCANISSKHFEFL